MEGHRSSCCKIFLITFCVILMLTTGILGYYLKRDDHDYAADSSRVQRQIIYNEESTSSTTASTNSIIPINLNDVQKTFDTATTLLKYAPQFLLDFGGKLYESEFSRIMGTSNSNNNNNRDDPMPNIFSVVKRS